MNILAALLIAENVRQRAEQGDCPTIPAQPIETLENVVLELQRALARDAVAGAIVQVEAERETLHQENRKLKEAIKAAAYRVRWLLVDAHAVDARAIEREVTKWEALDEVQP